jgi:hypothetical protein
MDTTSTIQHSIQAFADPQTVAGVGGVENYIVLILVGSFIVLFALQLVFGFRNNKRLTDSITTIIKEQGEKFTKTLEEQHAMNTGFMRILEETLMYTREVKEDIEKVKENTDFCSGRLKKQEEILKKD